MANEKPAQKTQLIYEFAILFQPLEELVRAKQPPSLNEYRLAVAKIQAGDSVWRDRVKQFTTFASDIFFAAEFQDISHVPELCWRHLQDVLKDPSNQSDPVRLREGVKALVDIAQSNFFNFIERIPITWEPVIFQANTPFTSYLRIQESVASVRHRLHYFDRYLKPDFFRLFLAGVDSSVSIRLVTTSGNPTFGVAGVAAVANLCRQQFDDFQLIQVEPRDLHDRNLRVDDHIFSLGPGVDRAGMALTNFGPSESSPEAHEQFDNVIAAGSIVS